MEWPHKIQLTKSVLLLILLVLISLRCVSQNSLTGQVKDGDTDKVIPLANIFLSNTTKGWYSDEHGNFKISNIPTGLYELVISCVGYETIKVNINTTEKRFYRIILKPVSMQLLEFQVRTKRDKKWKQYFNLFEEHFIGHSDNSINCKILNPEVIYFSDSANYFKAYARDLILIRNKGLGYLIKYALVDFVLYQKENKTTYSGYPVFEELVATNARQQEQWSINRKKAYLGSVRHFMQCLYTCNLQQEGFFMQRISEKIDKSGEKRLMLIHGIDVTIIPSPADTIVRTILPDTLRCNYLIKSSKGLRKTLFFKGPVQITYKREIESVRYQTMHDPLPSGYRKTPQVSIIYLNGEPIEIEADGHLNNPTGLTLELYWSWELLSESLPYDYRLADTSR